MTTTRVGAWNITIYPHTIRNGQTTQVNAVLSGYDAEGRWKVIPLKPEPSVERARQVAQHFVLNRIDS